ncbi:PhzF family phenazine biosynthesis protein [Dyella sp. LX-66]|uniref:PhzF family phenazine biosynthesis protein n=1 Tax=unclassified Dyella TaxID=2634549 RepID=UPI001BE0D1CA|nr:MULTISPECIES: PhzF family phenazine biosynthesis protein [unclassified Dyella]MBT2118415.1 PhzF family phenazine biosynthesis protein [Dyella sp. LX-1]MBT2141913.1 PhzF family phenazine biosynthesis protein [Dyella sp. LX-66]
MHAKRFTLVDVFSTAAFRGNPVAVVHDAGGMSEQDMLALARWTNLSETCFLLPSDDPRADYRLRIFSTLREMPFAGHPTLGAAHAWLAAGGVSKGGELVQSCAVGLVGVRAGHGQLAFRAPPLLRAGPVEEPLLARILGAFGLRRDEVRQARWVDNGAGWLALMLDDRERLLGLAPDLSTLHGVPIGLFAPWPGGDAAFEVRAFIGGDAVPEDPATGSLNAGLARWLLEEGMAAAPFAMAQGTAIGRAGRIHVRGEGEDVWIGGACVTRVDGKLAL